MGLLELQGLLLQQSTTGLSAAAQAVQIPDAIKPALAGDFGAVLSVLLPKLGVTVGDGCVTAADAYGTIAAKARAAVACAAESGNAELAVELVTAGAACLNTFVQHNLTGPFTEGVPSPIQLLAPHLADAPAAPAAASDSSALDGSCAAEAATPASSNSSGTDAPGMGDNLAHPHERWAARQLSCDGEDLELRASHLQYLLLAELLLVEPLLVPAPSKSSDDDTEGQQAAGRQGASARTLNASLTSQLFALAPSWAWWALRSTALHQHVLAGRSATLLERTNQLSQHLLSWAAAAAAAGAQTSEPSATTNSAAPVPPAAVQLLSGSPSLLACLYMEAALAQYAYGYVDNAARLLSEASRALGLDVTLTGALGKRTVHQIDAKAQLIIRATRSRQMGLLDQDVEVAKLGVGLGTDPTANPTPASAGDGPGKKETEGMVDDSDVLAVPKLVGESGEELDSRYSGAEQALLLCLATHVQRGSAQDELQAWEMAPYVEAVLGQGRSQPMLQAAARLLRVRHEKTRGRTRERALLNMELLAEALAAQTPQAAPATTPDGGAAAQLQHGSGHDAVSAAGAPPAVLSRLPYAYCTWMPLHGRLRKELAEQYMSLGFVGAALKQYEALEAWDALIVCYRLLEKKHAAEEVVRRRLKVTPDDPALWCALGDLHMKDEFYVEAWERSGHRNARAKRSLGRTALRRKEYAAAADHYDAALAINPLNPDAWFALGYACLKLGQQQRALRALTRVTQQQPDHAEAWNNVAALWLELRRPDRAFSALSECIRHKRDSWQVWENYAQCALQAGQCTAAARGLRQVMGLTSGSRMPIDVAQGLVEQLERFVSGAAAPGEADSSAGTATEKQGMQDDEEDVDGGMGALVLELPGLLLGGSTTSAADTTDSDAAASAEQQPHKSKFTQDLEAADERSKETLRASMRALLKEGVNSPACCPAMWGLLGRVYALEGEDESAKEALLKQVRALTGTSYKSDEAKFKEMAAASAALAKAYIKVYASHTASNATADPGATAAEGASASQFAGVSKAKLQAGIKELAAARMHLRGVLKQCEASFQEHEAWQELSQLLKEVTALEDGAVAASKAMA